MAGQGQGGGIPETYAGAGLRWALLLTDYPGAEYEWKIVEGTELGIPERWGGLGEFCVVTIVFPPESGNKPVASWKAANEVLLTERWVGSGNNRTKEPVELEPDPAILNTLITMTLGRACKRSGYVDDMKELASLVRWRLRRAELTQAGGVVGALSAGGTATDELVEALEQAAVPSGEHAGHDDTAPALNAAADDDDQDDETVDAEVVAGDPSGVPSDETLDRMRKAVGALPPKVQAGVAAWAKNNTGWPTPRTEALALQLIDYAAQIPDEPAS